MVARSPPPSPYPSYRMQGPTGVTAMSPYFPMPQGCAMSAIMLLVGSSCKAGTCQPSRNKNKRRMVPASGHGHASHPPGANVSRVIYACLIQPGALSCFVLISGSYAPASPGFDGRVDDLMLAGSPRLMICCRILPKLYRVRTPDSMLMALPASPLGQVRDPGPTLDHTLATSGDARRTTPQREESMTASRLPCSAAAHLPRPLALSCVSSDCT